MDEFRIEDLLDENLIFMNEEAPDYETLLHNLSDKLEEKGYVKEGYADAVIRREQIYPTGLPTNIMKVAVPACNRKRLCIRTTCTCCYIKRARCVQRNG